jgi:tol-pal system protein YbgF
MVFIQTRFSIVFCTALLCLLSANPLHAAIFDDDEARKAILDLRAEVRQRDAEQSRKNQLLSEQLDTLGRATATSNAKLTSDLQDANKQLDTLRGSLLDLNNALNRLKEDNARLRGQLEVLGNAQQTTSKTQTSEQQLWVKKLQTLEADTDARLKKLEPRTVAVDGKEAIVDRAEESSFNAALNQFKATDYKSAARAFETFVAQYPQSGLQQSAQFWLGNSQFAAKDSKAALATLQNMMQKFPQHSRAADAYLTMGHCYEDMNDKKRSADMYNYVITAFPNTPQAQAAQEALPKKAPPAPPKKR